MYFWAVTTETYGVSKLSPVISAAIERMEPIFLLAISGFLLYAFNIKLKEKITARILLKYIILNRFANMKMKISIKQLKRH